MREPRARAGVRGSVRAAAGLAGLQVQWRTAHGAQRRPGAADRRRAYGFKNIRHLRRIVSRTTATHRYLRHPGPGLGEPDETYVTKIIYPARAIIPSAETLIFRGHLQVGSAGLRAVQYASSSSRPLRRRRPSAARAALEGCRRSCLPPKTGGRGSRRIGGCDGLQRRRPSHGLADSPFRRLLGGSCPPPAPRVRPRFRSQHRRTGRHPADAQASHVVQTIRRERDRLVDLHGDVITVARCPPCQHLAPANQRRNDGYSASAALAETLGLPVGVLDSEDIAAKERAAGKRRVEAGCGERDDQRGNEQQCLARTRATGSTSAMRR